MRSLYYSHDNNVTACTVKISGLGETLYVLLTLFDCIITLCCNDHPCNAREVLLVLINIKILFHMVHVVNKIQVLYYIHTVHCQLYSIYCNEYIDFCLVISIKFIDYIAHNFSENGKVWLINYLSSTSLINLYQPLWSCPGANASINLQT